MRGIGTAAISVIMVFPGAVMLDMIDPAQAWQAMASRPTRGTYRTSWGPARVTDGPRGNRVSIQFDDGSYISIEPPAGDPGGRLIGYWQRPRGADGRDPIGIERWARRCDRPTTQHPIASRDLRSPWWGTVLLSTGPDGQLTGLFNSCNGLPHRPTDDREGLRMWLVEAAPTRNPLTKAPLTRDPAVVEKLLRGTRTACAGSALAIAAPASCHMRSGEDYYLTLRGNIPVGQGRVQFRPIRPDQPSVYAAIERRGPLPVRDDVPAVDYYYHARRPLMRGDRIDVGQPRALCRSDLWAVSLIDSGGRRHDDIGLVLMGCGPKEGSFAEDPLAK